jgi:hypothetical protein
VAAIESGFPLSTTRVFATGNSTGISVASITTAAASEIVVLFTAKSNATIFPVSISGGGLSFSAIETQGPTIGTFANQQGAYIWRATSSGALSGQTITVSWTGATNTQTDSVLTVYSVTGASASAGAHTGAQDQSGSTAALSLVVNAAGTGSLIFGCGVADNSTAQAALANTTIDAHTEDSTLFAEPAVWRKTTATASAGNVTVGSSSNEGNYSKAAVEILNAGGIVFEDDHWKPSPAVTDEMVVSVYHG